MKMPSLPVRSKALPTAPAVLYVGAVLCLAFLFSSPVFASEPDVDGILRRIFSGAATVEQQTLWLTDHEKESVRTKSKQPFGDDHLPYYVISDARRNIIGYAFVDDVKGLHAMITYLAALDSAGAVKSVEVLVYREGYGFEIKQERFRKQFVGKTVKDPLRVGSDIRNIAGATISTNAISAGVRKILAVYESVLKAKNIDHTQTHTDTYSRRETVRRTRAIWGTTLAIEIISEDGAEAERVVEDAFMDVASLTSVFSRYDPASEISRLNAHPGERIHLSKPFSELLGISSEISKVTHGMFNVRRKTDTGTFLDMDGIAKGYAVDRIVSHLRSRGIRQALVNFGESSITAIGAPTGAVGWTVAVRDARFPESVSEKPLTVLTLKDAALSVSGSYVRGAHITNPFTGKPPPDSVQAVVVGPLALDASAKADALSTALFAGGKKTLGDIERYGFEGLWLGKAEPVRTKHFSRYEKTP